MNLTLTIGDLTIDCANPERARTFYAALTGWTKTIAYNTLALVADIGLTVLFHEPDEPHVPPVWPEEPRQEQKQLHLDFTVDDVPSAVEHAIRCGATKAPVQYTGHCVTMLDTDGHPFCLCAQPPNDSEFVLYYQKMGYGTIPNPSVNIDCTDVAALRNFYAQLTGWDTGFHETALVAENKMVVHFMGCDFDYVPPVWPEMPGQQQKQIHFNFQVECLSAAVQEAIRLGARKPEQQFGGDHYMTLLDPEGHPFCLCSRS